MADLAEVFLFSRPRLAPCRNADGDIVMRSLDVPRFDHNAAGGRRGLLIEGRPQTAYPDRLRAIGGGWEAGRCTALHEYEDVEGVIRRRAAYVVSDHRETIDGFVNTPGRQREIALVPIILANRGGYVRWRRQDYALCALIDVTQGQRLAPTPDTVLIEG